MIGYDEKDEEHFAIAVGALCDSGTRASASSDSKIHDAQRWRSNGNGGQWTIFRVVFRMYGGRPYKVDLHERVFDATNGAYGRGRRGGGLSPCTQLGRRTLAPHSPRRAHRVATPKPSRIRVSRSRPLRPVKRETAISVSKTELPGRRGKRSRNTHGRSHQRQRRAR